MNTLFPANTRGIIFDLDGTLYHLKWYMKPLFALYLFPKWQFLTRYMSLRKDFNGREMDSGEELLWALAEELSNRVRGYDKEFMYSWINNSFYPTFVRIMESMKGSRPDLNKTLAAVKEKGYRLAVLSDFARIEERLTALNIPPALFNTLLSTETVGALKPCAGPFLKIAKEWLIEPADIVVVGDKEDTDGDGASRSGMACVRISDKKTVPPGASDWVTIREGLLGLPELKA